MRSDGDLRLFQFVEACKAKGASDEFLASFLSRRGWPEEEVYRTLGKYWERETGVAAPDRTRGGESSRDAFLYLLSFSTLATWTAALGSMLFSMIDLWFPDPVASPYFANLRTAVTWQMASIAVAFPIFLLVMRTILREAQDEPARLQSGVRKWLTYIALLLTAGAMICDLIWFLDYFLTGELTSRFVLKALTVMLICGAIFAYYLGSLGWDEESDVRVVRGRSLRFGIGATVVVAAAFLVGMGLAGTPSVQRRLEADQRRIQDLQAIAMAIHARYEREKTPGQPLPKSPAELAGRGIRESQTRDPETGRAYEYAAGSGTTYELCAVFSNRQEEPAAVPAAGRFWYHDRGRTCFTLDGSRQPSWY